MMINVLHKCLIFIYLGVMHGRNVLATMPFIRKIAIDTYARAARLAKRVLNTVK